MGISKRRGPIRRPVLLTKRDKVHQRVARIRKSLEGKRREKQLKRKVGVKRRRALQQQEELVAVPEVRTDSAGPSQAENDLLLALGLGGGGSGQWQAELEKRLKEANQKSIDNPQVRRVYGQIGKIFETYRSGKVPKAFKIIPNLQRWDDVLKMTRPQGWTSQAMFQAVSIFASNFDPVRAEVFFRKYLVESVRRDLQKSKKLNYHLYESLKKALYKTNAWFKGVLFEFCGPETLLKEIKVIESLLTKMSIPVISASVAMLKMMEMPVTSAVLHYLAALLSKNYTFPRKVIVTLTQYLLSFSESQDETPLIWHQLFLTLARQYSSSIDNMSKAALLALSRCRVHKLVSPEIAKCLT